MKTYIIKPHWQAISLGIIAGMRSMAAPAISSKILSTHHSKALENSPLNFIQSKTTANVLSALALGEFIGDKLPNAPDRTIPPALIGRCLSGALAGAGIYKAGGGNLYLGAMLGGLSACASTFASFYLRKNLVRHTRIIDSIVGTIEDTIVMGGAIEIAESVD